MAAHWNAEQQTFEEDEMASECNGRWESKGFRDKTPGIEERHGIFVVTNAAGNAVVVDHVPASGTAASPGRGTCRPGSQSTHVLRFQMTFGEETIEFRGIINSATPNVISCGSLRVIDDRGPDEGDTGTWQATKTA
jgi:hypothetical protein